MGLLTNLARMRLLGDLIQPPQRIGNRQAPALLDKVQSAVHAAHPVARMANAFLIPGSAPNVGLSQEDWSVLDDSVQEAPILDGGFFSGLAPLAVPGLLSAALYTPESTNRGMASELKQSGLLELYKDMPFVKRMYNPEKYPYLLREGQFETHRMAAEFDEEGNAWAFPTIQLIDGKLKHFENVQEALEHAKKKGNAIQFNSIEEADEWSRNYKKEAPEAFHKYFQNLMVP